MDISELNGDQSPTASNTGFYTPTETPYDAEIFLSALKHYYQPIHLWLDHHNVILFDMNVLWIFY